MSMLVNPYSVAPAGPSDPNFSSVVLLLHFDGANGATTTTDSSAAAHAMTGVTGLVLSSAQAKFGATSSDFSGAGGGNAWTTPDSADWDFGSGLFTVECFVRANSSISSGNFAFVSQYPGSGSTNAWSLCIVGGQLSFYYSTNGSQNNTRVNGTWSPSTNTWYHVAADRDAGGVLRVYVDGSVIASATVSSTFFNPSRILSIGSDTFSARLPGYMDEVRITKGVARYAGAFTPPSAAFPDS